MLVWVPNAQPSHFHCLGIDRNGFSSHGTLIAYRPVNALSRVLRQGAWRTLYHVFLSSLGIASPIHRKRRTLRLCLHILQPLKRPRFLDRSTYQ